MIMTSSALNPMTGTLVVTNKQPLPASAVTTMMAVQQSNNNAPQQQGVDILNFLLITFLILY